VSAIRREALLREADNLACQSWNEKMWSDGGPIDPSPTIEQAINSDHRAGDQQRLPLAGDRVLPL
jgi:hypothetical protein